MSAKLRDLPIVPHWQPRHHPLTCRPREGELRKFHQKHSQGSRHNQGQPARLASTVCDRAIWLLGSSEARLSIGFRQGGQVVQAVDRLSFALEDGALYHTYSAYARGLDALWGMYQWLDRAPKGRNETGPWWRQHDQYGAR